MMLRHLERAAIAGLLAGVGFLTLDALEHHPANFFRYIPRLRPGRNTWAHLESLWRSRPALVLGVLLLCAALLLALFVMVAALARDLTGSDLPAEEGTGSR
jgi:hypothetical protein